MKNKTRKILLLFAALSLFVANSVALDLREKGLIVTGRGAWQSLAGKGTDNDKIVQNIKALFPEINFTEINSTPYNIDGYEQLWDIAVYTELTTANQEKYLKFLQAGKRIYLIGDKDGHGSRNTSIVNFIESAGGGTLNVGGSTNVPQQVLPPFDTNLSSITYGGMTTVSSTAGTGRFISNVAYSPLSTAIAWPAGTLANAMGGALTAVLDVDFMNPDQGGTDGKQLLKNIAKYMDSYGIVPDTNGTVYVDKNVSGGTGTGAGWDDAAKELATALYAAGKANEASPGTVKEIWVAAGTYKPMFKPATSSGGLTDRDNAFMMQNDVKVYGGFAGGETSITDRDFMANETILSGDVGVSGDKTDNTYHVIVNVGVDNTALLDGFTITGGNANGSSYIWGPGNKQIQRHSGGGIYNESSSPQFANLKITGNDANLFGGGIYTNDASSDIAISKSTISSNNVSSGSGGGVYNASNKMTLSEVDILNNTATLATYTYGQGGGIYNSNATVTFTKGSVSGNTATFTGVETNYTATLGVGGGIYNIQSTVTLTNVLISDNSSSGNGGGIYSRISSTVNMANCLVTGNTSGTGGKNGQGAGIYNSDVINLVNVTIAGNESKMNSYSGMYTSPQISGSAASSMSNCIIWGNIPELYNFYTAPSNGYGTIKIANSLIQGSQKTDGSWNFYAEDGGGNFSADPFFTDAAGGDYTLTGFSPAINKGDNTKVEPGIKDMAGVDRIYNNGTVDMGAYEFSDVPAGPNSDGVLFVSLDGAGTKYGNSWDNAFEGLSEAIEFARNNSDVKAIWVKAGKYVPKFIPPSLNTSFENIRIRSLAFEILKDVKLYGGFAGTETTIDGRDFGANETILSGDMDADGTLSDADAFHVVYSNGDVGEACLDGFTVTGGNANGTSTANSSGYGGGIWINESAPKLSNLVVKNNYSRYWAGGIYLYRSSSLLTDIVVENNISNQNAAGIFLLSADAILDRVEVRGNKTNISGGAGIYVQGGLNNTFPTIQNSLITENTASDTSNGSGAGMTVNGSSPLITNVTITGNVAGASGGGVYIYTNGSHPVLTNLIIANNKAKRGGGMEIVGSATLTNVTITKNQATSMLSYDGGGGIFLSNQTDETSIRNSIIHGNTSLYGPNIRRFKEAVIKYSHTLVSGSGGSAKWNTTFGTDGGNNIDADPVFIDAANGDFNLSPFSKAINSGSNSYYNPGETPDLSAITKDINGNDRIYDKDNNGVADMGASESEYTNIMNDVTFESLTVTYDKNPHKIEVQGLPATGVTVVYTNNEKTDAGTYTATADLTHTATNYTYQLKATLKINKADQTITFPEIPNKKTGDAPFSLNATVTSGLPLTYECSDPLIATVSNTGMVTILASGKVTITVSQPGDNNYKAATPITQELYVVSADATLHDMDVVGDGDLTNIGNDYTFLVQCGNTSSSVVATLETHDLATVSIDNIPGVTLSADKKTITVDTSKPVNVTIPILVTAEDGTTKVNYTLTVERRFAFHDIVKMRWNNTLTVINNKANNGGYTFRSYKWFRNGQEIGTGQSYSAGKDGEQLSTTDTYYVEVTADEVNGTLRTCEETIQLKSLTVTAFPNPVSQNQTVYVEADLDEDLLEGAVIEIYTTSGIKVQQVKAQGRLTSIDMNKTVASTYIFKLVTKEGFTQNLKVVVK